MHGNILKLFRLACAAAVVCLLACGCCTAYMVGQHNSRVDTAKLLQIKATQDGVVAGIDLLSFNRGYFAAWQSDPWGMGLATLADAGIGLVDYKIYEKVADSDEAAAQPTYQVDTHGGNFIVTRDNSPVRLTQESK